MIYHLIILSKFKSFFSAEILEVSELYINFFSLYILIFGLSITPKDKFTSDTQIKILPLYNQYL